jgi:hypothetical protein
MLIRIPTEPDHHEGTVLGFAPPVPTDYHCVAAPQFAGDNV